MRLRTSLFVATACMAFGGFAYNPAVQNAVLSSAVAGEMSSQDLQGAKTFVSGVADHGIGFLKQESMTSEQRAERFRKLLHDSFDMKTIARFAMGRHWRNASDAQKKEYLALFEDMIVEVYSRRFNDYQGQDLVVSEAKPQGSDILVASSILSSGSPEVHVDWRVRKKDGQYRVVDILVEGVSMALTQRSDFSSVIQRGGGDVGVLLAHLKK